MAIHTGLQWNLIRISQARMIARHEDVSVIIVLFASD